MPIAIKVPLGGRRRKEAVRAEWRESYWRELEWFIASYCDPDGNYSRYLPRCPHGVVLTDPKPIFDDNGLIDFAWTSDCLVCFPQDVNVRRPRSAIFLPGVGFVWVEEVKYTGPGRLDKWPRSGDLRIQLKGYNEDPYDDYGGYNPPDHYVSPYDDRFRMHELEAMGGYIRSGKNVGVGIRARLGWGLTGDGGGLRFHTGRHLALRELDEEDQPAEDESEENRLTFYSTPPKHQVERPRLVVVTVDFSTLPTPTPAKLYLGDQRSVASTRTENGIVLYRRVGAYSWTDVPVETRASEPGKKRLPLRNHSVNLRYTYKHVGRGFAVGTLCGHCWHCRLIPQPYVGKFWPLSSVSQILPGDFSPVYFASPIDWTLPPDKWHSRHFGEKAVTPLPSTTVPKRRLLPVTVWDHHRIGARECTAVASKSGRMFIPTAFGESWRTERSMRDLAADLKMYRYGTITKKEVDDLRLQAAEGVRPALERLARILRCGDGHYHQIQIEKMRATAWSNLRDAQDLTYRNRGISGPARPCWGTWATKITFQPEYETHGNHREIGADGYKPPEKTDGSFGHRLEGGEWPELPEMQEKRVDQTKGIYRRGAWWEYQHGPNRWVPYCVLPLCTKSPDAQMTVGAGG